jgi:hypothetical protein
LAGMVSRVVFKIVALCLVTSLFKLLAMWSPLADNTQ